MQKLCRNTDLDHFMALKLLGIIFKSSGCFTKDSFEIGMFFIGHNLCDESGNMFDLEFIKNKILFIPKICNTESGGLCTIELGMKK